MSVARVTEIISNSTESFDDAIRKGMSRATKTLKNVQEGWVASQKVGMDSSGRIVEYRVCLKVTFVLDD